MTERPTKWEERWGRRVYPLTRVVVARRVRRRDLGCIMVPGVCNGRWSTMSKTQ